VTIPHILLWAAFGNGPRVRRDVSGRDVLAEHLDWARRSRRGSKAPEQEEPFDDPGPSGSSAAEADPEGGPPPLDPIDVCDVLASAAVELEQAWQADVLASVPSQLLVGLSGTAARAAFLLDETAPALASRLDRLGELFMSHGDGHRPVSDEELGLAVDELEALVSAVAERAREAFAGLPPEAQEALRQRWKARAEEPRGEPPRSCRGCS
jgi:hypothetical protein